MRSPKVPWWPGSVVSDSGVHLHHLVFGIVTMMIAGAGGFAAFGNSPWTEICAFAFGIGAGLTIDEFALWVYLDDVYWAEEGRSSIDATVIAAAAMMLVAARLHPVHDRRRLDRGDPRHRPQRPVRLPPGRDLLRSRAGSCTACIGFFVFPIALYGACRLGKPRLGLGAAPLRRAPPEEAGPGRGALPARTAAPSASRTPSATSSAASRARAWRRPGGGLRRDPRGERRSAPAGRTGHPPRRRQGRLRR